MTTRASRAALLVLSIAASSGGAGAAEQAYQLAAACASCHASAGDVGGIPRIAGLDEGAIEDAMLGYRSGRRESQVMRVVSRALSPEEINAVARYLASQELARR